MILVLLITATSFWLVLDPRWVLMAGHWSYVGAFIISMVASATVLLPAPGAAIVIGMGTSLDPYLLGIAAGMGSAVGEMTGYIAGATGSALIPEQQRAHYERIRGLTQKYGPFLIFFLSAVPLPFFDIAGIVAGALRMRVAYFFGAVAVGKCIRYIILILVGAGMIRWLLQWFQQLFA